MKLKTYFGKSIEGAYEKYLEENKNRKEISQPENTYYLQGIDRGNYIYMQKHNLYVAKERSHLGKNWYECHQALHQENSRMLTLREFADFLLLLKNGDQEFKRIYNEITEVRDPLRAEWLDADFKVVNNKLHINYNHRTVNGNLTPQNSESLTGYLNENRTPGISLDEWLSNSTSQGLPKLDIKGGDLYYWAPMSDNKSVARFDAGSVWADLDCGRDPRYSSASLGVRSARRAAP